MIFRSMIGLPTLLDKFIDITGHEINWHDREMGWTGNRGEAEEREKAEEKGEERGEAENRD